MALLRARASATAPPVGGLGAAKERTAHREEWLSAAGGLIVGRPDLVRGDTIVDYKTGDVYESNDSTSAKALYVRQLQVYAFLFKENTGRWPTRGVLIPMEGPPLEIDLEANECERVVAEALELLDRYNRSLHVGSTATALGNPSPDVCRWCPFQLLCPAFWEAADESWAESLGAAAVGGESVQAPQLIHAGAAIALTLSCDEGTERRVAIGLAPLNPDIHRVLGKIQAGTRIRAITLAKRPDAALIPTSRTVIALPEDLPPISCGY